MRQRCCDEGDRRRRTGRDEGCRDHLGDASAGRQAWSHVVTEAEAASVGQAALGAAGTAASVAISADDSSRARSMITTKPASRRTTLAM